MKAIILIFIVFLVACNLPTAEREPYIGTVNGEYMPLSIYMIYLQEQIEHFERIGGTSIWDIREFVGTQTAEQIAMEHALKNMALSLIIRNISEENNIFASEFESSDDPNKEFFNESIAIRKALMHYLTAAYAADSEEIFLNMEEAWLEEAIIIRNISEWDEIRAEWDEIREGR